MKILITFILCFNLTIKADASAPYFIKASPQEISLIKQEISLFYAKELFAAGLYQTEGEALKDAIEECDAPDSKSTFFYYIIAKEEESNCGYLCYSIKNKTAYIESIFLKEHFRGVGIGKKILQNLEKELKEKEVNEIELYVFAHNQSAYTLYKKTNYFLQNSYYQNDKLIGFKMKKNIEK